MDFDIAWKRYRLYDGSKLGLTFTTDVQKLPKKPGVYIFARKWGSDAEALYVGKADDIRGRINQQFNNHRLMNYLDKAANGSRVVYAGVFSPKKGQQLKKCLPLIERALIRYFVANNHKIANRQGTKLQEHTIYSMGFSPRGILENKISIER